MSHNARGGADCKVINKWQFGMAKCLYLGLVIAFGSGGVEPDRAAESGRSQPVWNSENEDASSRVSGPNGEIFTPNYALLWHYS